MSPGATFERVYETIKQELRGGRYLPGAHLEPALLSDGLNASITPVRDALHRLAGERLVETPRGEGFRFPLISERKLRHLYMWNQQLLQLALRMAVKRRDAGDGIDPCNARDDGVEASHRIATIFLAIAARTGNSEHGAAIASLNDRLACVRCREPLFIADLELEADRLDLALDAKNWAELGRLINAYHRRRLGLVEKIVGTFAALG